MLTRLMQTSLASKIYVSYGLLLVIALSGALLAWQASKQSSAHLERAYLANEVYLSYLKLSGDAYQLINQLTNSALLEKESGDQTGTKLLNNIQQHVSTIRRLIGIEIQMVGNEEIEELEVLAKIDRLVKEIIEEYADIAKKKQNGAEQAEIIQHLQLLSYSSKKEAFNQLVAEAILEEASEADEVLLNTMASAAKTQNSAIMFSLVSLFCVLLSLRIILRDIREPLRRLHYGASRLADEETEHRIEPTGPAELRQLGLAFNQMADGVADRQRKIVDNNKQLEKAIAERTAELKELLEKLQSDTKNRRRLIADVSHELRTPLTVIKGEADIALRGQAKPAEEYQEALSRIRTAATHTARIVDDLLFVARKESGEIRLNKVEVDLAALLRDFIENHHIFGDTHANIKLVCLSKRGMVFADSVRIQQVLLILLENAVHYGGGHIQLKLASNSRGFTVSVSDQGPGMSETDKEQAFERFFRGNNATDRYDGGAGLGLPVAKSIVEAHGGTINIDSSPGEGTTVSFSLLNKAVLSVVS